MMNAIKWKLVLTATVVVAGAVAPTALADRRGSHQAAPSPVGRPALARRAAPPLASGLALEGASEFAGRRVHLGN
jgi:hypothetical protein